MTQPTTTPTPTVLIVDDDRAIRELLKMALESEGYTVWTLENGVNVAATLLTAERPCVVLLDLMMPTKSGWEVIEELKRDARHARHAVIAMTAGLLSGDPGPAGVRGTIRKPFDIVHIYDVVEDAARSLLSAMGHAASSPSVQVA